jgi:flagellar protein FlaG
MIDKVTGGNPQIQTFSNNNENNQIKSNGVKQIQALEQKKEETTQEPVTKEKLQDVVHGMNELLSSSNTHLKFEFHDELKEYYITIIDDQSKEVVREIPAKRLLDMHAAMTEFVGLMVDKKI